MFPGKQILISISVFSAHLFEKHSIRNVHLVNVSDAIYEIIIMFSNLLLRSFVVFLSAGSPLVPHKV